MTTTKLPLSDRAEAALLIEKNHAIKKQRAYLEKLEAMSAQEFLECGLQAETVSFSPLTQVLVQNRWDSIRCDEANNHWYITGRNYELRITGDLLADRLNAVRLDVPADVPLDDDWRSLQGGEVVWCTDVGGKNARLRGHVGRIMRLEQRTEALVLFKKLGLHGTLIHLPIQHLRRCSTTPEETKP